MVIAMSRFFRPLAFRVVGVSMIALQSFAQNPLGRPAKFATDFNWSMSPAEELGQPGR
jgi:hypothetical protein